jgi:hypothetical protein
MKRSKLGIVNYRLLNGSSVVTFNNSGDFYERIGKAFPEEYIGMERVGESNRTIVGTNGSTVFIYSNRRNTDISIPKKHEKDIREKLEAVGLKLEERKCL